MRISIFIFLILIGSAANAETDSIRINRVTRENVTEADAGRTLDFGGKRHFDKFYESDKQLSPEDIGEEFIVRWVAAESLDPISIHFDYRSLKNRDTQNKIIEIGSVARGSYRTLIEHKGQHFQEQGKISSWRIQIMHDGQVMAERQSSFWSQGT